VDALGEERRSVLHALNHGNQPVLDVPRELALDSVYQTLALNSLVLVDDRLGDYRTVGTQDPVELSLVSANFPFACFIKLLGQLGRHLHVVVHLVPRAVGHGDEEAAEVARGLPGQFLRQVLLVEAVVGVLDGRHLLVGAGAYDLHQGVLVGSDALHGVVQVLRQQHVSGLHHRQHHALERTAQLTLQLLLQVLAIRLREGLRDLDPLRAGTVAEHVDDGRLVSAEALHGLPEEGGIGAGVEGAQELDGGAVREDVHVDMM